MLSTEKPLKILRRELKSYGQPYKNMLEKQIQLDILSQLKKWVGMNEIVVNVGNLEVNGLKVV